MTTFVTFLQARLDDEYMAARDEFVEQAGGEANREAAEAAFERTLAASALQFNIAVRQAGVAVLGSAPAGRRHLARRGARYADHPDYEPSWSAAGETTERRA
ncbi:MAG: hypothetical protein ACRDYU_00385 [Actinomycetes bacterium]